MHTRSSTALNRDFKRQVQRKALNTSVDSRQTHPAEVSFVQSKSNCSCGGGCPSCQTEVPVQAKLNISQANDRYEREADYVAAQVVGSGNFTGEISSLERGPQVRRLSAIESPTEEDATIVPGTAMEMPDEESGVQRMSENAESEEEENPTIQRLKIVGPAKGSSAERQQNFERRLGGTRFQGEPLKPGQRRFLESRFGRDFGQVRIHNDSQAQQLSSDINARAFTYGGDIYFNQGEYQPETPTGMSVLAHELTHVVQQGAAAAKGSGTHASATPGISENHGSRQSGHKLDRMPTIGPGDTPSHTGVSPWGTPQPIGNDYRLQTDAGSHVLGWVARAPFQNSLRYWCHGYSLGTYRNNVWGYSVYSGGPMRTVLRDEWHRIRPEYAKPGDLAVWTAFQHSAVFSSVVRTSAGSLDENASRLRSKNGQQPLATYSLTALKRYGPRYHVYRRNK